MASQTKSKRRATNTPRAARSWTSFRGHPSVRELMASQGTRRITDVSVLHGEFWPEDESVEEFLKALSEWRGHNHTEPAV